MLIALIALSVFSVLMAIFIVVGLRKVQKLEKHTEFIDVNRFNDVYEFIDREILNNSYTGSLNFQLNESINNTVKNIQDDIKTSLNNISKDVDKDVDRRLEKIYKKLYELDKSFDTLEKKNKEYCEYLADKIRGVSKHVEIKDQN